MKIAVFPARGGSKRIPHKNIKEFCSKPMIAYSIEAALQSGCFDKVIVSTDEIESAEVAKKYGTKSPPIILPKHQIQDIDAPEDWERGEWLFKVIRA